MKQKLSKNKYLYKRLKFEEIKNPQYFFNLWTKSNLVKFLIRFFFNKEKFIKFFDFRIISSLILHDLKDSKSSILNSFLLVIFSVFLYRSTNKTIIEKKYLNLVKIVHGETNYYGYEKKTLQKVLKKTLYIFSDFSFSNLQNLKKKKKNYLSIKTNLRKKLYVIPIYDSQISDKLEWWKLWVVKEILPNWNISANSISKINTLLEKRNTKDLKHFFKFYIDNIICQNYDWENKFNSIFYKNCEKEINSKLSKHEKILEDTLILQIFSAFCEKLIFEVESPQNLNRIIKWNKNELYSSSSIFYEKKVASKLSDLLKKKISQNFDFWNESDQIITKFYVFIQKKRFFFDNYTELYIWQLYKNFFFYYKRNLQKIDTIKNQLNIYFSNLDFFYNKKNYIKLDKSFFDISYQILNFISHKIEKLNKLKSLSDKFINNYKTINQNLEYKNNFFRYLKKSDNNRLILLWKIKKKYQKFNFFISLDYAYNKIEEKKYNINKLNLITLSNVNFFLDIFNLFEFSFFKYNKIVNFNKRTKYSRNLIVQCKKLINLVAFLDQLNLLIIKPSLINNNSVNYQNYNNYKLKKKLFFNRKNENFIQTYQEKLKINSFFKKLCMKFIILYKLKYNNFYKNLNKYLNRLLLTNKIFYQIEKSWIKNITKNIINKKLLNWKKKKILFYYNNNIKKYIYINSKLDQFKINNQGKKGSKFFIFQQQNLTLLFNKIKFMNNNEKENSIIRWSNKLTKKNIYIFHKTFNFSEKFITIFQKILKILVYYPSFTIIQNNFLKNYILNENNYWSQQKKFDSNNKLITQRYFNERSITKFIVNYFYNNKNTNNIYIKDFSNTFFSSAWQNEESYFNSIKIFNKNLHNFRLLKKNTLNLLNFLHYSDFNYKKNSFFLKKKNKNSNLLYKKLIKSLPLKKKEFLFINQLNFFYKKKHEFLTIKSEIFKNVLFRYLKKLNYQKLIFIYTYNFNKLLNSLVEINLFFYEKKNINLFTKKIYIQKILKPENNLTQIKFEKNSLVFKLFLTIKDENNKILNWTNYFFISSNSIKNLIEIISNKVIDINNTNNSTRKINYKENKKFISFFSKNLIKLVQKPKINKIIETSSFFIKWTFFKKYIPWFFTLEWWKYFQNRFLNLFSEILLNINDHFNYILPTVLENIEKNLSDLLINSSIIIKKKIISNFFEKWNLRLLREIYDHNRDTKNEWLWLNLNLVNKWNTKYIVIISLITFGYLIFQNYFSTLLGSNFFELWTYFEIIRYFMDSSRGFYLDNLIYSNSIQFIKSENLLMHFIKNFEHYIKNVKFYLVIKQKINKLLNNNKGLDLSRREKKLLVQSLITDKSLSQYKSNLICDKNFQFHHKIVKQQKCNYLENLTEIYQKNLVNYSFYQCHLVETLVFLSFWQKTISSQILWQIDSSDLTFYKKPIPLELRVSSSKGILLIGSLETGRSYLVKDLAANSFVPLIKVSINKLLYNKPDILTESWINILMESLRRLSLILELAEKLSPCIIWIQNIHELNVNRSTQNVESDPTFLLGIFLKYSQTGFIKKNTKNIVIIGSSHLPKKVDPALISPNRLNRLINIRMLNILQRQKKISILLYNKHSKYFYSKDKKQYLNEFAYRTMGYNSRDLTGLINEILLISITQKQKFIHENAIRLAFYRHTLGSTYMNTKIKLTQNYGILFYKVGKVVIQNIFVKNFSKNPLYIGNDLWKKKFYYLSEWYLEPSIFAPTLKEFTILPYILSCLAGLAARDSWFILENKPDNLISLDKSIENDFYLACGILESLLIDFPWLEIIEENDKKKNVIFQFQIKNPLHMIKKGLFLTVDENTTNKISNKSFKQITFSKSKLYELMSNITWTPKLFRLNFIRSNLFNWIKRPNELETIYNSGLSKKKEKKDFNGSYGVSNSSGMRQHETKEQLPYERVLSRIRRRNVQELESQLEAILFEEQFKILGFSRLSTEYRMESQLSNKPMIFIGGRFIWDPTGLLYQNYHFVFSRQFLFIDEEMLRRLYVTYGTRREREKSHSSQKIKQFFLRRGYGRDYVNDLSINWWNQLPLIEKNNIETFKRIEGIGVQLKRPQVFTPVYLYQNWLIENSKENLIRFELLDNRQRWLKANTLLFNDSFTYNTLLEIYKYLLNFFISHQFLLKEMTNLLLKNKWLFQNEIEYFINIINRAN
uniref:Protein Ycf2 n=1 Tax=Buxbaumia aphylla TaxID=70128 RepID=A0A6C0M997_BUXAP|nr:hypothetical chloroplast RF21 [Buxbaumia aphylla]QHU77115.1 hypothetical chloroplast RF21 [Buxbaumia aphylla]